MTKAIFHFIIAIGVLTLASFGNTVPVQAQQVEVGKVSWNRNLDKAMALSAKNGKPLFVQFQEVPG